MNRMIAYLARILGLGRPTSMAPMAMLDCEDVMRSLWDYLDHELTPDRMDGIRAHIDMCKRCYPQYEFERAFLDALGNRKPTHTHPELVRQNIMTMLVENGMLQD